MSNPSPDPELAALEKQFRKCPETIRAIYDFKRNRISIFRRKSRWLGASTRSHAHATSTPAGDRAELRAIKSVFGANNGGPFVSSTKSKAATASR